MSAENHRRKSMLLQEIFAQNVRIERAKAGLSQEQLAEICGYHRTYIGSVERGERNITLATLDALAAAFEMEPYQLLMRRHD